MVEASIAPTEFSRVNCGTSRRLGLTVLLIQGRLEDMLRAVSQA